MRENVPCPPKARNIILAQRFPGLGGPWDIEGIDVERMLPYLDVLNVEAQAYADRAGLGPQDISVKLD